MNDRRGERGYIYIPFFATIDDLASNIEMLKTEMMQLVFRLPFQFNKDLSDNQYSFVEKCKMSESSELISTSEMTIDMRTVQ